jgi:hypothetical protein
VGVKRIDALGREYTGDSITESMEAHLSYLRLVNVPCMFDIGSPQANPRTGNLTLSMMDSLTHKVVKQQFLAKNEGRKFSDIEKLREQVQAIHSNMHVSAVLIRFDKEEPLHLAPQPDQSLYHLTIDGVPFQQIVAKGKKAGAGELLVTRIAVSRVLKSDLSQASIPLMTFLPLKQGPLKNQHLL